MPNVGVNKTVRQNVDVVQENLMQCDPAKRVSESKAKPDEECIIYKEAPVMPPVVKDVYSENVNVANMTPSEVVHIRQDSCMSSKVEQVKEKCNIPNPIQTFDEAFGHYPQIMDALKRAEFIKPLPIQMQGWPVVLKGHDFIGVAKAGTGKTLTFLLPALVHIEGQPAYHGSRGGPYVLVLVPNSELAIQTVEMFNSYKPIDLKCLSLYGGGDLAEQTDTSCHIIVATPDRLLDLIERNVVNVKSVTYLVLDEADLLLNSGLQPYIVKILTDIRPQSQMIMQVQVGHPVCNTWPPST